jgi:hypothetical protein
LKNNYAFVELLSLVSETPQQFQQDAAVQSFPVMTNDIIDASASLHNARANENVPCVASM